MEKRVYDVFLQTRFRFRHPQISQTLVDNGVPIVADDAKELEEAEVLVDRGQRYVAVDQAHRSATASRKGPMLAAARRLAWQWSRGPGAI